MIQILAFAGDLGITSPWVILAGLVILVFGVGRLVRVITYDAFPPAVWWRTAWAKITNDGPWEKLFSCFWCLSPWVTLVAIAWAVIAWDVLWLAIAWWAFWGWLGIAYMVAMVVDRDEH